MKKRILYIHHGKGLGGAPLSLMYLIKNLDQARYEPVVLFLHNSEALRMYQDAGITVFGPVHRRDFPHTNIWWHRWYHPHHLIKSIIDTFAVWWSDARAWLERIQPDLVHLNTSSLIAWGTVAKKMGIPVVWHIREPLANGYFGIRKKLVSHIVHSCANAIVPISKRDGAPWITDSRTSVIYNPVETALFNPDCSGQAYKQALGIPDSARTILFVGGLAAEKGTDVIIRAFRTLVQRYHDLYLIIAGYGDFWGMHKKRTFWRFFVPSQSYTSWVQELLVPVRDRVICTGPTQRIPELMAMSSVLVFPATVGHFARPVIEAGCMAKPVVASNLAPLDEIVVDGITGYLVPPYHTNLWVDRISRILDDHELAQQLGNAAYEKAITRYSSTIHASHIQAIYQSIMHTQKGSYGETKS